jgi:hypothetical protein
MFFLLNIVISIFKPVKNHPNITNVPHFCEIAEVTNRNRYVYSIMPITFSGKASQPYVVTILNQTPMHEW